MSDQLPEHIPIDMAMAPDKKPYEHTHIIQSTTEAEDSHHTKLAQHSLSPEKLGVVGYVKDVASFIKDAIEESHEKKKPVARRSSHSSITTEETKPEKRERRRSSSEVDNRNTLGGVATGLFPGVGVSVDDKTVSGCTHADELRNQMMHLNEQDKERKLI